MGPSVAKSPRMTRKSEIYRVSSGLWVQKWSVWVGNGLKSEGGVGWEVSLNALQASLVLVISIKFALVF